MRSMEISLPIEWTGSNENALALLDSISPDDSKDFTITVSEGGEDSLLTVVVEGESLRTLRVTIDDILACLSASESAIKAVE